MPSHPTLTNLLERARRRLFGQLALDKGALALVIGMAAVILLLLAGTQILDWYWPVLLTAGSLGVGIYRLRKSLPSVYKLAQQTDRRLGLADSLSTAVHFAAHPEPEREAICEVQRREAEIVAQRVDIQQALPPSRSRYLLPAAGLALVAFGLFAVRYAVTGSLSLQPSLLKIAYDSFFGPPPQLAKNQTKRLNMPQNPFDPGNPDAQPTAADQQPQDLLNTQDANDAGNPQGDDNAKQSADKDFDKNGVDTGKEGKDQGDDKNGKQGDQGSKDGKDAQDKEGGNQDKQSNNPNDSGVLNKIKDALANMLNKMKPSTSQNPQQNANNQSKEKGEKSEKGDQGSKQQDSQNAGAEPSPDSNQSGERKNADDAKSSSQPGKPSSQESASGAGSKDGDKAVKDAKALEAMGQISEILGKRSATVTGEMMVEVGQTKQTLKTAWADRQANHAESGGEIHRDEVPLMFQPFVERYFEEIRKTPSAAKSAPKTQTK